MCDVSPVHNLNDSFYKQMVYLHSYLLAQNLTVYMQYVQAITIKGWNTPETPKTHKPKYRRVFDPRTNASHPIKEFMCKE